MAEENKKPSVLLVKAGKSKVTAMIVGLCAVLIFGIMSLMASDSPINRQISRGEELTMMQILWVLVMASWLLIIFFLMIIAMHFFIDYMEVYTDHVKGKGILGDLWKGTIREFVIPIDQLSGAERIGVTVVINTKDGRSYRCFIGKEGEHTVSSIQKLIMIQNMNNG